VSSPRRFPNASALGGGLGTDRLILLLPVSRRNENKILFLTCITGHAEGEDLPPANRHSAEGQALCIAPASRRNTGVRVRTRTPLPEAIAEFLHPLSNRQVVFGPASAFLGSERMAIA